MPNPPAHPYHFEPSDHSDAIACLERRGFCVMSPMIGAHLVDELKDSIDRHLDPDRSLPPASNRYHMAFAEASEPVWRLVDHAPYWDFICAVHGTRDLCLHRSAAILRTAGEAMGAWHVDFRGHIAAQPGGSRPSVFLIRPRCIIFTVIARIAQLAERFTRNEQVRGSNPLSGSSITAIPNAPAQI